jgi:hypothetical protein
LPFTLFFLLPLGMFALLGGIETELEGSWDFFFLGLIVDVLVNYHINRVASSKYRAPPCLPPRKCHQGSKACLHICSSLFMSPELFLCKRKSSGL